MTVEDMQLENPVKVKSVSEGEYGGLWGSREAGQARLTSIDFLKNGGSLNTTGGSGEVSAAG